VCSISTFCVLSVKVKTSGLQTETLSKTYRKNYTETPLLPRTFIIDLSDVITRTVKCHDRLGNSATMGSTADHQRQWSYVLVFRVVPNNCSVATRSSSSKSFSVIGSGVLLIRDRFYNFFPLMIFF